MSNFESKPCEVKKVKVCVGKAAGPNWWCKDLEGTVRNAVQLEINSEIFFFDNEGPDGFDAVVGGKVGTQLRKLPQSSEVVE